MENSITANGIEKSEALVRALLFAVPAPTADNPKANDSTWPVIAVVAIFAIGVWCFWSLQDTSEQKKTPKNEPKNPGINNSNPADQNPE